MFYLEKVILDDKKVDLLMVKKLKFSKGVSPWFLSKIENWNSSFLNIFGVKKVFNDV